MYERFFALRVHPLRWIFAAKRLPTYTLHVPDFGGLVLDCIEADFCE